MKDKKQTPQLIVLGLLVLTCIGYVSFSVTKPPATEMTPPVHKITKPNTTAAAMQLRSQPLPTTSTYPDLNAPIPRRDPFAVQRLASTTKPEMPDQAPVLPVRSPTAKVVQLNTGKVPPLIPMGSFQSVPSSEVAQATETEAEPQIVLTGVICGAENVAIIKVGSQRHIVKQGQFIDGRYKVLSVSTDGVVLAFENHRIHVKLGGVPNAS